MIVVSNKTGDLRSVVLDELAWDSDIDAANLNVTVDDDVVTLIGTVRSFSAKIAAQEAAHRVRGVRDVANDINVVLMDKRTDTELAQAIRSALEWDVAVPHKQIQTTVSNGWVTLEGNVPRLSLLELTARIVRRIEGVTGITNNIKVEPDVKISEQVQKDIRAALLRQAGTEADRIKISGREGNIVLTGTVHSWAEHNAIFGAASHPPGVRSIEDHVSINASAFA